MPSAGPASALNQTAQQTALQDIYDRLEMISRRLGEVSLTVNRILGEVPTDKGVEGSYPDGALVRLHASLDGINGSIANIERINSVA
jgi:hypothetical protein